MDTEEEGRTLRFMHAVHGPQYQCRSDALLLQWKQKNDAVDQWGQYKLISCYAAYRILRQMIIDCFTIYVRKFQRTIETLLFLELTSENIRIACFAGLICGTLPIRQCAFFMPQFL